MDSQNTSIGEAVFRVADLETTGLDPATDRVCEIAWRDVRADGTGESLITQQTLINPGIPIPPAASAIHHIVDADVAGAPALDSILPRFTTSPEGLQVVYVAHNADFERGFLGNDGPWLCTYRLALHLWPDLESHGNQYLRYALGLNPDLPPDAPAHRAANDVAVTTGVLSAGLQAARNRWPEIDTIGDLIGRIEQPALLRRVPFKSSGYMLFEDADEGFLEWIVSRNAGGRDCVHTARYWLDVHARNRLAGLDRRMTAERRQSGAYECPLQAR